VTRGFPVRGASVPHLIDAHKRGQRLRLRDGRPDLPPAFVSVVERALDPVPERRFASAGEMEAALTGGSIDPIVVPDRDERSTLQKIAVAAAEGLAATLVVGWITCRVFDMSVGVHSELAADPLDYMLVGAWALFPFGVMWSLGAGILAAVGSLGRPLVRRLAAVRSRIPALRSSADGATLATCVLMAGFAGWVAISWRYGEIFSVLESLMTGAPASAAERALLGSAGQSLHRAHFVSSAFLSFLLALALWRWFPRFEQRAVDADRVRLLKWATMVVTSLVIVTATAPRRVVLEPFEVVAFDDQPAFVIASSSDELLLYYPYAESSKHRRVRKDASTLQRTGAQARLFDQ
jgi:hypothetical protein